MPKKEYAATISAFPGGHPPYDELPRPNEPLRPLATLMAVRAPVRIDTRPKPLGFCLPTPAMPPTARLENSVGRGTGRYEAARDGGGGGAARRPPRGGAGRYQPYWRQK